jgi:hypothetical protein
MTLLCASIDDSFLLLFHSSFRYNFFGGKETLTYTDGSRRAGPQHKRKNFFVRLVVAFPQSIALP